MTWKLPNFSDLFLENTFFVGPIKGRVLSQHRLKLDSDVFHVLQILGRIFYFCYFDNQIVMRIVLAFNQTKMR